MCVRIHKTLYLTKKQYYIRIKIDVQKVHETTVISNKQDWSRILNNRVHFPQIVINISKLKFHSSFTQAKTTTCTDNNSIRYDEVT